ncbi:MAG TPA: hypothetical protein DDY13_09005 [Cytophagales bacterium]|jgi:hypothetical protein|nr:hypothetical protein [Cytophagales bacterium]
MLPARYEDTLHLSRLISKDLSIDPNELEVAEKENLEDLHKQLTLLVRKLLDQDFQFLMNAMYRIDISENDLAEALNTPNPENVASEIASLVIRREMKKMETRKKYSSGKSIF